MRQALKCIFLVLALSTPGFAQQPVMGPQPSWVRPVEVTAKEGSTDTGPVQLMLSDVQMRFGAAGDERYQRSVYRIASPQGLAAGAVAIEWNPETEDVRVHKIEIRRGNDVIDVLKKQEFLVLRRETALEYAMLNGRLTATVQPEGVKVGDVIELAFTITSRDPVVQGASELSVSASTPAPIGRLHLRAIWDSEQDIRWRASPGIVPVQSKQSDGLTEVRVDLTDVQPTQFPSGAPTRFLMSRSVEFSEFRSWSDVSALFAPLYDKAAMLSQDTELRAEIDGIKASSSDPKVRAAAALALVQDHVRYVFLGMELGALKPADADRTWARRYGDCKGKTALLLALLRELGVKAEPALVNTYSGDGLDQRLPQVGAFDHVIVRASIDGKTYWLDGTSAGDVSLDHLGVPPFSWALPVRSSGAVLEKLTLQALAMPEVAQVLEIDATKGRQEKARIQAVTTMRGDSAKVFRVGLLALSTSEVESALRDYWSGAVSGSEAETVAHSYDASRGELTLTMNGSLSMSWIDGFGTEVHEIKDSSLGGALDVSRDAAADADAPYAVAFPFFVSNKTIVRLPDSGRDYTLRADDIETTIGGVAYRRRVSLTGEIVTMEASQRSLVPEISAVEARAGAKALPELYKMRAYVLAPPPEPTSPAAFANRGISRVGAGDFEGSLPDLTRAIELDPTLAVAHSNRGIAYFWLRDYPKARLDFEAARRLDPDEYIAEHGFGLLATEERQLETAIKHFSRAIELFPENAFAYGRRAYLQLRLKDYDRALADGAKWFQLSPNDDDAESFRRLVLVSSGRADQAIEEVDAALANNANDAALYFARFQLVLDKGDMDAARRDLDTAISLNPSARYHTARAEIFTDLSLDARRADLEAALKLEPADFDALWVSAKLEADAGEYDRAIRFYGAALALQPEAVAVLIDRGETHARAGNHSQAEADFARARIGMENNASVLNQLCWARATSNLGLEAALRDCEAALALRPDFAAAIDSRGLVELRLGLLEKAISTYDAALELAPNLGASLYGRGIAKLRKGMKAEGEADIAAAKRLSPTTEAQFSSFGVAP